MLATSSSLEVLLRCFPIAGKIRQLALVDMVRLISIGYVN
jgi:hypothetical protein